MTSSYSSTFLRDWKLRPSTLLWAFSMALGEHLVLDGGVLVQAQRVHHVLDPLAAEEAHQVVLQGEVEPGLAGVALAAGTAAQLVVDPAGLVALGADDEEAAGGADLLRLAPRSPPCAWPSALGERLPGGQNLLVVGFGVAGGLGDDLIAVAGLRAGLPWPGTRRCRPA